MNHEFRNGLDCTSDIIYANPLIDLSNHVLVVKKLAAFFLIQDVKDLAVSDHCLLVPFHWLYC